MNTPTDERANLPSASGIPRLVHCAGSPTAEALFPGEEQTEVATSGSNIHAALETGSDEGLVVNEKDVAENLKKIEVQAIEAWQKEFGIDNVKIIREERLWIRDENLNLLASAKPDVVVIGAGDGERDYGLALDFKSGYLDADPSESNWQLKTQAIAVQNEHGVDHVRAAIIQHRFGSRYDPVDYDADALRAAMSELKFYIHLSKQPDAPRVPGSWCRYCRARGSCPEAGAFALLPQEATMIIDKKEAMAQVALLTPAKLASLHNYKTLIVSILDAVSDRLKQLPAETLASVGLELKPNSPMRSLPNIQKVYELLTKEGLLQDEEEFRSLCKVSVGAVEELVIPRLQKKLGLDTVKAADFECSKLLAPIVVPVTKNPSLKPIKKAK